MKVAKRTILASLPAVIGTTAALFFGATDIAIAQMTASGSVPQPCTGSTTVTDKSGNKYDTVQINTQCWMRSNLRVDKYRNGDTISYIKMSSAWMRTTEGAWAVYNDDSLNDARLGKLYNHHAVMDIRGLCPTGWHVPTDQEWTALETFLGGSVAAAAALRSKGGRSDPSNPAPWGDPKTFVTQAGGEQYRPTNSSGFTATSGGYRSADGFFQRGNDGYWWSSSPSGTSAWARGLMGPEMEMKRNDKPITIDGKFIRLSSSQKTAFSVRCLRD
jgi:uncharacterized protein (TIGR02145 family)